MRLLLRATGVAVGWFALAAAVPANPNVTLTSTAITVLQSDGHIISTATLCPGYQFDQLGRAGPRFSPDQHWILVDVLGPFAPGNVERNHALVRVTTGQLVTSANFQHYLGVPATSQTLAWASGERETLRYNDGKTVALNDPPPRPLPAQQCAPPTPR